MNIVANIINYYLNSMYCLQQSCSVMNVTYLQTKVQLHSVDNVSLKITVITRCIGKYAYTMYFIYVASVLMYFNGIHCDETST